MGLSAAQLEIYDHYKQEYDRLWPLLENALLTYGPTHSKNDIWGLIESGCAQFWPMKNAAMVTTIEVYPTGFKELNGWLAGGDLQEIIEWQPTVEAYAKAHGCRRSSIRGRRGWLKAFTNYRDVGTIMLKDFE